jgi:predicted TIM-barrel fold metal-dependent hydrolase
MGAPKGSSFSNREWAMDEGIRRTISFAVLIFSLSACAPPDPARPVVHSPTLAPVVDHHQHLWSENATAFTTTPPLPVVMLPPAFGELLTTRTLSRSDRTALEGIYTPDAVVLDPAGAIFVRGREGAAGQAGGRTLLRAVPVAYGAEAGVGWIAGTFTEGEGSATRHIAEFLLVLRREADGRWRIAAESTTPQPPRVTPRTITAETLIAQLDAAGVRRAVVLSSAYFFGSAYLPTVIDEHARVRAENDWVGAQAARFPDRLVAFCGLNPLKAYAAEEVRRCADAPNLSGLKLHFANSGVDLFNADHVAAVRQVFRAANESGLPIVVHVWVPGRGYGAQHSRVFLEQLLPEAPDVAVQIAHLTGTGPGYAESTDQALSVFTDAVTARDPRIRNLYFDVASNVVPGQTSETRVRIAARLRALGMTRVLFGSDSGENNQGPKDAWASFRELPLTNAEFDTVATNTAPYLRQVWSGSPLRQQRTSTAPREAALQSLTFRQSVAGLQPLAARKACASVLLSMLWTAARLLGARS